MTETQLNNLIDTLHFNSFKKVINKVKEQFPNVKDEEVRRVIKKRIHDRRINKENKKIYQVKVFSKFQGAWMTDIYDNLNNHNPRYWEIFININTRYIEAYPLMNKTKDAINTVLRQFINVYHPRKITSDEEAGLISEVNLNFLKNNKCGLYIIQEKNHSSLSLIDRAIRTLRDMNRATGNKDSTDDEFKYIDINKMNELLNVYNNTIHSSTGHTPKEMMNNKKLENEYIEKCIDGKQRQQEIQDFKLKEGSLVRYYLDNDPLIKKRYTTSRECYKIESRTGNIYTIIAKDGTTKDLPRWRLIYVNPNEKYVLGETLNTDKGIVEEIIREVSANKVEIRYKMPDSSNYTKVINKHKLRNQTPQIESVLEKNFKDKNK